MKSEAEIRKYRDALRKAVVAPCDCSGTQHADRCYIGGRMMAASITELSWVLDEACEHDRFVEGIIAAARRTIE